MFSLFKKKQDELHMMTLVYVPFTPKKQVIADLKKLGVPSGQINAFKDDIDEVFMNRIRPQLAFVGKVDLNAKMKSINVDSYCCLSSEQLNGLLEGTSSYESLYVDSSMSLIGGVIAVYKGSFHLWDHSVVSEHMPAKEVLFKAGFPQIWSY